MSDEMYRRGQIDALTKFAAADARQLSALMSGVSPAAGGLSAALTAPDGESLSRGFRTGLGAYGGQTLGGNVGGSLGTLLAFAANKDPQLYTMIGEQFGRMGGGALGGHIGYTSSLARE